MHDKIRDSYMHPQFVTDVMKPMQIDSIIDQDVSITSTIKARPFLVAHAPENVNNCCGVTKTVRREKQNERPCHQMCIPL